MQDTSSKTLFTDKLLEVIHEHLSNENFGVSELASEMGMSRSNLLRKIKKETTLSASQYIRQVRLKKAMELLLQSSLNISEISYKVGFSSTSYFIKCFREYYGYPPGEAEKRAVTETVPPQFKSRNYKYAIISGGTIAAVMVIILIIFLRPTEPEPALPEKSIVVLPFINHSNDSSNVYFINGIMEATLNNLQKISDLRVLSRTSAEKYRNSSKTIPEMAKDLGVSYFVEGSGQKIGDNILLNIQLIEATSDKHLWAQQYERQVRDIFKLQQEIAKDIARQVQAIITPAEQNQIDKIPTKSLVAYDHYLKGLDLMVLGGYYNLNNAIPHFKNAVEHDHNFALAHANLAITYYYMDIFQEEKQFTEELNMHADRALLLDSKLPESLLAKAFYYMHTKDYDEVIPYLEKAHEYNPNSALVLNTLSDYYGTWNPNTVKYLEYALKGIKLDITSQDSTTASYTYLHLSNALIQNGFVNEALHYIEMSLNFNPDNFYSNTVKAYIHYAKNGNLKETKRLLQKELRKDTTRLDLIQELGKVCFYLHDYDEAYQYYKILIDTRKTYNLDIYQHENLNIASVLAKVGLHEESEKYLKEFKEFTDHHESVYKPLLLAGYYMETGDEKQAIEYLRLFAEADDYQYWIVLFLDQDPVIKSEHFDKECQQLIGDIKNRFWKKHEILKNRFEEEGLLRI